MEKELISNFAPFAFYSYYSVIAIVFIGEVLWEKRPLQQSFSIRWLNNIGLEFVSSYAVRWLIPVVAMDLALRCSEQNVGVLNLLNMPLLISLVLGLLALDAWEYWLHRLFHRYLFLWRFHLIHHSDLDLDFTTHVRHHPLESLLGQLFMLLFVVLMGLPALAVMFYSVAAFSVSFFAHSNISLPAKLDSVLRCFIITPDMHRVHHSIDKPETNSNYGMVFPWWDKIFGTYVAQPAKGHLGMVLGLDRFRSRRDLFIDRMLVVPFTKEVTQRAKSVADVE